MSSMRRARASASTAARLTCGAALAALLALVPNAALAQPAARDAAAAEALFQSGVAMLKTGDWPGACKAFEGSMKLDPSVGTQINLARCADHDGKIAQAWAGFRRAKALNAETPLAKRKANIESYVDGEIQRLEASLPWVTLVVRVTPRAGQAPIAGAPAGLTVERDGVAVPTEGLSVPVPVDPGKHTFRASAPGYVTRVVELEFAPAQKREALLELVPEAVVVAPPLPLGTLPWSPASAPPDSGSSGEPLLIAGVTVGALGAGGLIVAAVTGGIALSDQNTVDGLVETGRCTRGGEADAIACVPAEQANAHDAISRGESLALVSTITMFAGAGLAATGVVLIAIGATSSTTEQTRAMLLPMLGQGTAGLTVMGSFQ